ncbi:MAG: RecX family transcriptional regulator [Clostridia bacterium]|nr:RecX family transcriptional regulator [Clostridia bacterium]
MKEISEITSQARGDRLNIFLDGEFAFGVEYQTAVKFGLKVGKCLSQENVDDILTEEGNVSAFNRALKYAVKKTVSEKQMREYLKKYGYLDKAIDISIDKLKEYSYIGDDMFAKAYVSTYKNNKGNKRIEMELKKAGVESEIIADALKHNDDSIACMQCIDKYKRTHKDVDKRKLAAYLVYRGFDYEDISYCIARSEHDED